MDKASKINAIKEELFRREINRVGDEYDKIRNTNTEDLKRELEGLLSQ